LRELFGQNIANLFVRDELMIYFIVDNTRHCEAVKAVLDIAEKTMLQKSGI
jgi:hypothetical protein